MASTPIISYIYIGCNINYRVGIKIATQYNGVCSECETKYKIGEMIYYDKEHTNSKGNAIVCKDYACFSEQGGKVDVKSGSARTTVEDLSSGIFSSNSVRAEIRAGKSVVEECFTVADEITKEIYSKLDPLSNTFGQIRNAFKTDLVNIYNANRICNNKTVKESIL